MNTYNKIILCAVSIAALFLFMGLSVAAANDGVYELSPVHSTDMYNGSSVEIYAVDLNSAQYIGTIDSNELVEDYYDGSQVVSCWPFDLFGEIYSETITSFELKMNIPFADVYGRSFDSFKLDKNNNLVGIDLNFMCLLRAFVGEGGYTDYFRRSLDFSIVTVDEREIVIRNDDFDTGSNSLSYNISLDNINIPVSEISHFRIEFAVYSLANGSGDTLPIYRGSLLKFGFLDNSTITISNDSLVSDGIINNANDSVTDSIKKGDDVIGEIDKVVGDPQVDLDNINTDGLSEIGQYFNTENPIMILVTSLALSSLGVATIGYILHGKRG